MKKIEDAAFLESLKTEVIETDVLPDGVKLVERFPFTKAGDREITLDIYDRDAPPSSPRPAIVFLHGGCWMFGSPKQFFRQASYLALRHGIFGVSVDYRMSEEAPFPAALQDAKCAVRWVRSQAAERNIDPDRIAVAGGSAGGHLTAMVATTAGVAEYEGDGGYDEFSSRANLAMPINGEFDMWDLIEKGSLIGAMEQFFGGTHEEIPAVYDACSPVKRVHKDVPPMLFLHGDQDKCVSHEQSIAMSEKLLALGVPSEVEIYAGKPHAWFNKAPDFLPVLQRMEAFLVKHFGL